MVGGLPAIRQAEGGGACSVPEWLSCWNGLMRRASSKPYGQFNS